MMSALGKECLCGILKHSLLCILVIGMHWLRERTLIGSSPTNVFMEGGDFLSKNSLMSLTSLTRFTSRGSLLVFLSIWIIANLYLPTHFFLLKYWTLAEKGDMPFNAGPDPSTLRSKILFKCTCVFFKISCLLSYAMLCLTMCRWTWTKLSTTFFRKFLPLEKFETIHK